MGENYVRRQSSMVLNISPSNIYPSYGHVDIGGSFGEACQEIHIVESVYLSEYLERPTDRGDADSLVSEA